MISDELHAVAEAVAAEAARDAGWRLVAHMYPGMPMDDIKDVLQLLADAQIHVVLCEGS